MFGRTKYKKDILIFLDVDGVLNTKRSCVHAPSGIYVGIDNVIIELFF